MSTACPNVVLAAPEPSAIFSLQARGGSSREMIDGARASLLLAPLLGADAEVAGRQVEKIVLGGKSFGTEGGAVLATALRATPALVHADFADCIAGRHTDEALATLQLLCDGVAASGAQLHSLDLSDNALGVRGIPRIAAAFANQPQLRHLYFNNDGLQAEAVAGLTTLIMDNFGGMTGKTDLQTFEIGHNCLEDAGFLALIPLIERSPLLRQLRIATTRVRNNQGAGLAMANTLLGLKHLTSLALNDNNLGSEAGEVLARVIAQNGSHLRSLNIGDIGVEEEGIQTVIKAVSKIQPNTLQHLDLAANELTGSSRFMKPLCAAVRAQAGSLQHLKLEDNELKSRGAAKLLTALSGCTQLTYLNLTNNHLGARVVPQLVAFLKSHPNLKEVHLNGNHFTADQMDEIKAAIAEEALTTMSDNEEESEEDESESEADEEEAEAEESPKQDADVDALAAGLAATSVAKD